MLSLKSEIALWNNIYEFLMKTNVIASIYVLENEYVSFLAI